ncbi:MAG: glycoside hydrolase family 5 protein [Phycisphaerae bacterium]
MSPRLRPACLILPVMLAFVLLAGRSAATEKQDANAFDINRSLGDGVNMGNMLEAPREGEWGVTMEKDFFAKIAEAGFDSVRIPVRWDTHADANAPYRIDPAFLKRVRWAVDNARRQKLAVVLNFHHHESIYKDPNAETPRFVALWKQVAEAFSDYDRSLVFELLNEPHGKLDAAKWNDVLAGALAVVRKSNPTRAVMVGPAGWNSPNQLDRLQLPADDHMLIVTFHYYSPFHFTHQGAEWVGKKANEWLGKKWADTAKQRKAIEEHFARVATWGKKHRRPIYLGEFGAYGKADMESRVRWTRFVRTTAERHDMAWAYWEFGAGFGVYDRQANRWRKELLNALLGR